MGEVSDYISSLENKENIDPVVIASTLLELHNEEIAGLEQINTQLTTDNETATNALAEKDELVTGLKNKLWDYVNRVPSSEVDSQDKNNQNPEIDPSTATFDDFFEKEE